MRRDVRVLAAALRGSGWIEPELWSFCPFCGVRAPRPGLHDAGCPAAGLPERTDNRYERLTIALDVAKEASV